MLLAACSDHAPRPVIDCSTLGRAKSGFGSAGSNRFAHGMVLCPTLRTVANTSCARLQHIPTLATIIERVAREPTCCKLGWAGVEQSAFDLASLLVGLASSMPTNLGPLRLLATHASNGWVALLVSVYLTRVHGGRSHGLLIDNGKSEWMHAGDVRLLLRQCQLSYRFTSAFEPAAELALMSFNPTPNRAIMPVAAKRARSILPPRWEGDAPPFDACVRVGSRLTMDDLQRDIQQLVPYCKTLSFWSGGVGHGGSGMGTASSFHVSLGAASCAVPCTTQMHTHHAFGNWTVFTSTAPAVHFVNDFVEPPPPPPSPPLPPRRPMAGHSAGRRRIAQR